MVGTATCQRFLESHIIVDNLRRVSHYVDESSALVGILSQIDGALEVLWGLWLIMVTSQLLVHFTEVSYSRIIILWFIESDRFSLSTNGSLKSKSLLLCLWKLCKHTAGWAFDRRFYTLEFLMSRQVPVDRLAKFISVWDLSLNDRVCSERLLKGDPRHGRPLDGSFSKACSLGGWLECDSLFGIRLTCGGWEIDDLSELSFSITCRSGKLLSTLTLYILGEYIPLLRQAALPRSD